MPSIKPFTIIPLVIILAVIGILATNLRQVAHMQNDDNAPTSRTSYGQEIDANNSPQPIVTELLQDRRFENGVRPPTNGANILGAGSTCLERWKAALPSTPASHWQFITVAENTRFCDNPNTPSIDGSKIIYASKDGSKRFEIDQALGEIRYVFDTGKEWRNGCNLCLPQDGVEPQYMSGAWNWPHFLLSQDIEDPNAPDKKLRLGNYDKATFEFEAELISSAKGDPPQCPPGTWGEQSIPDHCFFYATFVMKHETGKFSGKTDLCDPTVIYEVYPLFYSDSGERYDGLDSPWLGLEPANNPVYITADNMRLEPGRSMKVSINAHTLTKKAVAAINKRYNTALSADGYFIQSILVGWEIWGAYRTDIRLSGLSIKASTPETIMGSQQK